MPHGRARVEGSATRRAPSSMRMGVAAAVLAASDPPDLKAWGELLAVGVHIRVGNRAVVLTRPAAKAELARLFADVAALGRGFRAVWPGRDRETLLMELDLLLLKGIALPCALVLRTLPDAPLIQDLRFYCDPTPLGLTDRPSTRGLS